MTVKVDGSNGLLANYDFQTPTTGFSYTFTTFNVLFANPAGTLATGTVTMSATPVDGTTVTITSTQQITALTINANTGQSIIGGGAIQLNANTSRQYLYRSANTTWYLINVAAGNVVTSAVAGTGVSVSSATGAVTITNTGVTSAVAGNGVAVSAATGAVTFSLAAPSAGSLGTYVTAAPTAAPYGVGAQVNYGDSVSGANITSVTRLTVATVCGCKYFTISNVGISLSGTWRFLGGNTNNNNLFVRIA
jgi:hypothetical protein